MPKIIPDDRARQGPPGRPVLAVLLGALLLCGVAIGGYLIWVGATSPDDPSRAGSGPSVTGSTSNPTDRTSPANPAYPAPANPSAAGNTKSQ